MYLKTLEIQGFKSFPDRIKLDMPQGITAVVGPNGSGKSNVSDSIRWVLGEQSSKSLRGEKMEDVIFSGTKERKPLGFAEVSIVIDNETRNLDIDSDDIKITRKYYRSGESEYKINGQNVRLRDIHELFMDTGLGRDGYSIIGQGKIDQIVNSKSTERRLIFEEAAGISKFRYRKEQAEKKLDQTEENLLRLRDILSELEVRIEPLREQSEKATQFLELSNRKRDIEISLWLEKIQTLKETLRQHENKIYIIKGQYKDIETELVNIENEIQNVYVQVEEKLKLIEEKRSEKKLLEDEIASTGSKIAVFNNDIFHNNEQIARIENDIQVTKQSSENSETLLDENEEQKQVLIKQISEKEISLKELETNLNDLNVQNTDFSDTITDITRQINVYTSTLSNAKVEITAFETSKNEIMQRQQTIDEEINQKTNYLQSVDKQIDQTEDFVKILNEKKQENINTSAGYTEILKIKETKFNSAKDDLDLRLNNAEKLKGKAKILSDMEKNMEGFAYSVKFILNKVSQGMLSGIYGPVFKLIKTDAKYSVAIETALGAGMQNIICQSENDAKQAIYALKKSDSGRATFLPIATIKGTKLDTRDLEKCEGFVGLGCDLLSVDDKFQGIICSLLGRIVIVDEFDNAVNIAKKFNYKFKVVTLDGQVVNAGGSLTGGSNSKNSGLLSRQSEIDRLNEEYKVAVSNIEEGKKSLAPLLEEISKLKAASVALSSEAIVINEDIIKAEAELNRLISAQKDTQELIEKLINEKLTSTQRLDRLTAKHSDYSESADNAEQKIKELEKQVDEMTGSRQDIKTRRNSLFDEISAIKIEILGYNKDLEKLESTRNLVIEQREGHATKISDLQTQKESLVTLNCEIEDKIRLIESESVDFKEKIVQYDQTISNLMKERLEIESKISEFRKSEKENMNKKEDVSRELTRLEEHKNNMVAENESLIASLLDEYELTLTEAYECATPIEDAQQSQKELFSIKSKIKSLGSVNVAAIEEYKEVNERYLFMKAQITDVEDSKKQLTDLINELNTSMKNIFSEKFNIINTNFNKIFKSLFGGGSAYLEITDKNDILNSGIEIKVEPPGKIINNISALSGGEIALVAVSIYFAILKVNPSPFCVLDEIDAALDDVNVNKLAAYLKNLNDKTQFISITHKRGTMEEADVLYGVTMQEKGVSKLLKLDVSEVEEKLGISTK